MINDIKDLKKLFALCRAQGVDKFKMNGIEIDFGSMPDAYKAVTVEADDELDEEGLIFYSTPQGQSELDKKVGLK